MLKYKAEFEVSTSYQEFAPNNCAIILRDGDCRMIGPCCLHIKDGFCPSHGQVYSDFPYKVPTKTFWQKVFDFFKDW